MEFDPGIVLALGAFVLAGLVQGSSGFGFSLVLVGLAGLALRDAKAGAIVPIFANLTLTTVLTWRYWRYVRVRQVVPFLVASLTGVPLGVWVLSKLDAGWVNVGIALILLVSGTYALLPRHRRKDWHPLWLGVPCGLLSGGLAGAFNTGGPPAVAYLSNRPLTRFEFVASLQFIFTLAGVVRLGFLSGFGLFDQRIIVVGLLGIAGALLGGYLGTRILKRLGDHHLRVYVCAFQLLLGGIYIWRALAK